MNKLLVIVLCVAVPLTVFASDNGYKVTYHGGSIPDAKVTGFMVGRAFGSASPAIHFHLMCGKSSMAFWPYRKTNPQNCKDYIGDPSRQQMKSCRNHHN
jgi:hypothetical protein